MQGYKANRQGQLLTDISKFTGLKITQDSAGEKTANKDGDVFYIQPNVIWEKKGDTLDLTNDPSLINAMSNAVMLGLTEVNLEPITEPQLNENTEKIVEETDGKTNVTYNTTNNITQTEPQQAPPIQWRNPIPTYFAQEISVPEQMINQIVRLPLIADDLPLNAWFWNDLPRALIQSPLNRPPLYIIASPEGSIRDIEFADNRPIRQEARGSIIIQGFGQYHENSVFETAQRIENLIRDDNEETGRFGNVENQDFSYDATMDLTTRTINYTVRYDL